MKREIKFRAWSITEQRMIDVYGIGYDFVTEDTFDGINEGHNCFMKEEFKLLAIMQYTGLKDKNGVEIYEGDILENKKSQKGNFFVRFNCGGFDAVYKGNFTLCLHPVLSEHEGANVVGNIYQNPELVPPEVYQVTPGGEIIEIESDHFEDDLLDD